MADVLTISGLDCFYGETQILYGLDLALRQGEVHCLLGRNGAGKTTFVSLICGRVEPTSGIIVFDGQDITNMPPYRRVRQGIAYTFQITSVFAHLTAYDNVALPVQRTLADGRRHGAVHAGVMSALSRVGLAGREHSIAGTLSYGHQRLLEVAMGLALKPRLLILDEPTQGLSDGEIENFISLVREIARDATVLLIEHNMPVVMELADRITVMNAGQILAEGTPEQIRANVDVQHAYLGTPQEANADG